MHDYLSQQVARDTRTLLGLPLDVTTEQGTAKHLAGCCASGQRCFLSTPNLNFLAASLTDPEFHRSVLQSDWVVADGMPLIWVGRLLGLPLPERVAGSGVFDLMRRGPIARGKLKVFFFGGEAGVAERAAEVINAEQQGMTCVGWLSPGFGSVEEMSTPEILEAINRTEPDFIVVALGAKKGQAWIMHNREHLKAPVISHLGAVVNFVAGTVKRSPRWLQVIGAEWLWRMYEEPHLFKRYWSDGVALLRLMRHKVVPLWRYQRRWQSELTSTRVPKVTVAQEDAHAVISVDGILHAPVLGALKGAVISATESHSSIEINLGKVRYVDAAAMGFFQVMTAACELTERKVRFSQVSAELEQLFRWYCTEYLLDVDPDR